MVLEPQGIAALLGDHFLITYEPQGIAALLGDHFLITIPH